MASAFVTLALLAGLAPTRTQAIPNLSGTWVVVPEASIWHDRLGRPVNIRIFGDAFVARQDDRTLSIAIANENGFEWRYHLDGTESHHTIPLPSGNSHTVSRLSIEGEKVVINTTDGSTRRTIRTIELKPDGTIRVEAPFGEAGAMISSVYRRVRD